MPIVRIATNLARNQLPQNFMSEFANYMAPVLNKRVDKMTCILETDKEMSFKVLGHYNLLINNQWHNTAFERKVSTIDDVTSKTICCLLFLVGMTF